jgi:HK97 family phage portal protein
MSWVAEQMAAAPRGDSWFGRLIERHAIDKMKLWGTGQDIGEPVHAGVSVTQDSALRLSVVWRCVRLLAETLSSMPAQIVRQTADGVRIPVERTPPWIDQPNPETDWYEFADRCHESFAMDGNTFVLITSRDANDLFPRELWTMHPSAVQVVRKNGRKWIIWNGDTANPLSVYGPTNPGGDVLHIKGPGGGLRGLSPIEMARQAVGLGLVAEKFGSRFFGRGQTMSGVIELPAMNGPQTKDHISLMRENWETEHAGSDRSFRPGVLTGGATWRGITISPEEAQFLQTRSFQVEEIASRFYGIPPNMVGLTEKQTSWGSGVEAQATGFVRFTLLPRITRFQAAMSSLLPRGQYLRLDPRYLLQADAATEADVLTKLEMYGVLSPNEVRQRYGEAPRKGGDTYLTQSSLMPATGPVQTPVQRPEGGQDQQSPNGQVARTGG